jgi:hypothetical protein
MPRGGETLALVATGLPQDQAMASVRELAGLITRLHEWTPLLKLANRFLRDRVLKFCQPLTSAVARVGQRQTARGLLTFDDSNAEDYEDKTGPRRKRSASTLICSMRSGECASASSASSPRTSTCRLESWRRCGGRPAASRPLRPFDLLSELFDLSLLLDRDLHRIHASRRRVCLRAGAESTDGDRDAVSG